MEGTVQKPTPRGIRVPIAQALVVGALLAVASALYGVLMALGAR